MSENQEPDALIRWSELARENAENAIVSSMFEATLNSTEHIERFSTWLLVGTAAIASFFIINSDKLIPYISELGYKWCAVILCFSCIWGFASKVFSVLCQIGIQSGNNSKTTFEAHIAKYEEEEAELLKTAKNNGVNIETGVRIDVIMEKFLAPAPTVVRKLMLRNIKKHRSSVHAQYLSTLPNLHRQGFSAGIQAVSFLAFLVVGFYYAIISFA